jgi:hypothetical protein
MQSGKRYPSVSPSGLRHIRLIAALSVAILWNPEGIPWYFRTPEFIRSAKTRIKPVETANIVPKME